MLRVVSEILTFQPKGTGTDLGARARLPRPRGAPEGGGVPDLRLPRAGRSYERALRITARRHDLIPVSVIDPLEEELPDVGFVELEDPETGETVLFDTGGPEAAAFARAARAAAEARKALFKRLAMDPSTSAPTATTCRR